MGFDAKRPVPWKRLLIMFGVYAVVANIFLYLTDRTHYGATAMAGTLIGGVFYLALASVMAKFGWAPKSMAESRAARVQTIAAREAARASRPERAGRGRRGTRGSNTAALPTSGTDIGSRARPAPTRRTASGVGRQGPPSRSSGRTSTQSPAGQPAKRP